MCSCVCAGLCPDWLDWDAKQALRNAKEAMDSAETWMNVPQVRPASASPSASALCAHALCVQLLKPEEMVDPRVDEKAMITYLAQYPSAKVRPDAPLRPRANAARVRAYGPGASLLVSPLALARRTLVPRVHSLARAEPPPSNL